MSYSSVSPASQSPTYCDCGLPVVVAQAWTDRNPGRRFWACPAYDPVTNTSACRLFKWYDEFQTEWQKKVILRMKRENERVTAENRELRTKVNELQSVQRKLKSEMVMVKKMKKGEGIAMVVRGGFWTALVLLFLIVLAKIVME